MELTSRTYLKPLWMFYGVLVIHFNYGSVFGLCSYNGTRLTEEDCFKLELHAKYVEWISGTVDNNLPLYGRINENITVGVYMNASNNYHHMLTLFGTYVKNGRDSSSIRDENKVIEDISHRLTESMWPNYAFRENRFPLSFLDLVVQEIRSFGYENDMSSDSETIKEEFLNHFYFDTWMPKQVCNVFVKNQTEDTKYLICLSPYLSSDQIDILYKEYFEEVAYINYTAIAGLVSVAFKCLTLLVYIILPSLRKNIYGKCIFLYLISAIVSYGGFSLISLYHGQFGALCKPLGFTVQFAWLTNFTLQSVMCFEILLTVSFMRNPQKVQIKKFKMLWYCLYAYGFPATVTLVTIIMQFSSILSDDNPWKPNLGGQYCFFPNNTPDKRVRWLYFYGIYSVLIVINNLMFLATVVFIRQSKAATSHKGGTFSKSMFTIHIKLFFVMGCNWIFDVIILVKTGTSIPDESDWFLRFADSLNFMIGIILFIVLVCNKETLRGLKSRYIELLGYRKNGSVSEIKADSDDTQNDNSLNGTIFNVTTSSKV